MTRYLPRHKSVATVVAKECNAMACDLQNVVNALQAAASEYEAERPDVACECLWLSLVALGRIGAKTRLRMLNSEKVKELLREKGFDV